LPLLPHERPRTLIERSFATTTENRISPRGRLQIHPIPTREQSLAHSTTISSQSPSRISATLYKMPALPPAASSSTSPDVSPPARSASSAQQAGNH
jgi:hypothetical protein